MMNKSVELDMPALQRNLKKIQSKIFKLLPMAEEGQDYTKPLETLILELLGVQHFIDPCDSLVSLICKLQGLVDLDIDNDFLLYRRSIFECCGLVDKIIESIKQ